MVRTFKEFTPRLSGCSFIADNASIIGNVSLAKNTSVWYGAVLRADTSSISIDENSNIQDNVVIHTNEKYPVTIGKNVSVGHGAVIHGATVGDDCVIGLNATLLNGCKVGKNCIIAAGALVMEGQIVPDGSLFVGVPGRVVRKLSEENLEYIRNNTVEYIQGAKDHEDFTHDIRPWEFTGI